MFGFVKKIGKGIASAGKAVVKSPVLAATVTGVAMVFPPAAPVAVGVVAANRVVNALDKKAPKKLRAVAQQVVKNTAVLAKTSPDAAKALNALKLAAKAKSQGKALKHTSAPGVTKRLPPKLVKPAASSGTIVQGFLISPQGRISRGSFRKTA